MRSSKLQSNKMAEKDVGQIKYDLIIVGGGIMGSCAAYEASKRGCSTLLLEQLDFLHNRGSSHGESRTMRVTYPEPYYSSLLLQSSSLWEEAQSLIGYRVLYPTTHLDVAFSSDPSLQAVIATCRSNSVPFQLLNPAHLLPTGLLLPDDWIGLVTQGAAVIKPTKAVSMFQTLAFRHGAVLRDNMRVTSIARHIGDTTLVVSTQTGERFYGRKCVITAGAWVHKLVRDVTGRDIPIHPLETTICYWKIKQGYEHKYSIEGGFPTFAAYGSPYIYGTPSFEYPGLIKVAVHGGRPCDPDERTWAPESGLMEVLKKWVGDTFGGEVEHDHPVSTQSCIYSMTPDEDYVIDFLGEEFGKNVVIAGGFSGHGFKMGPIIGKVVVDMALEGDASGVELGNFKLARFDNNPKGNHKKFGEQVGLSTQTQSAGPRNE